MIEIDGKKDKLIILFKGLEEHHYNMFKETAKFPINLIGGFEEIIIVRNANIIGLGENPINEETVKTVATEKEEFSEQQTEDGSASSEGDMTRQEAPSLVRDNAQTTNEPELDNNQFIKSREDKIFEYVLNHIHFTKYELIRAIRQEFGARFNYGSLHNFMEERGYERSHDGKVAYRKIKKETESVEHDENDESDSDSDDSTETVEEDLPRLEPEVKDYIRKNAHLPVKQLAQNIATHFGLKLNTTQMTAFRSQLDPREDFEEESMSLEDMEDL